MGELGARVVEQSGLSILQRLRAQGVCVCDGEARAGAHLSPLT